MKTYLTNLLLDLMGINTAMAVADEDDHLLRLRGTTSSNNIEQLACSQL